MTVLLSLQEVTKFFGGIAALDGFRLDVATGDMLGLIGPNGSGKTTLLNIIGGYYRADGGRILLSGERIDGRSPTWLARRGLGRSFQVTKVFRRLTVLENLLVPALAAATVRRDTAESKARGVLVDLNLTHLADARAETLSGGQGKLLEFGRIMMLDPRLVLLDEPFGGVHPELKAFMHERIRAWNAAGVTIVLISHDMGSIFGLCDRVAVLSYGALIAEGAPDSVRKDPQVLDAYLGTHHES